MKLPNLSARAATYRSSGAGCWLSDDLGFYARLTRSLRCQRVGHSLQVCVSQKFKVTHSFLFLPHCLQLYGLLPQRLHLGKLVRNLFIHGPQTHDDTACWLQTAEVRLPRTCRDSWITSCAPPPRLGNIFRTSLME